MNPPKPFPRICLSLGSGGMFGAYQVGVWMELERILKPGIVFGASIGSLNGWAIAGGASGEELRDWWLRIGNAQHAPLRFPRDWLDGIVDSRPLASQIEKLHATYSPRCDIGVVLTRLAGLRPTLAVNEKVTWRHLAASCAVIGVLQMQRLDGSIYADGGLIDPLPATGLNLFRPDVLINVNVLPFEQNPGYRTMIRGLQRLTGYKAALTPGMRVLELGPPKHLGGLKDAVVFNHSNFDRWVEAGRSTVRSRWTDLEDLLR